MRRRPPAIDAAAVAELRELARYVARVCAVLSHDADALEAMTDAELGALAESSGSPHAGHVLECLARAEGHG